MRLLSRLALGEAGTIISATAATHNGSFDGVSALSAGTLGMTIGAITHTGLVFAANSVVTGDISQVTHTAGGPIAIYIRKD